MDEMIAEIVALWVALYSPESDPIAPSFSLTTAPAGVSAAVGHGNARGSHGVVAKPTTSSAVAALRDVLRKEARAAVDEHARKIAALRAALGEVEPQPVAEEPEAVSPFVPAVGSMWRSYASRRLCTVKRVDASGVHLAAAGCAMETVGLRSFYEKFEAARPAVINPDRDD